MSQAWGLLWCLWRMTWSSRKRHLFLVAVREVRSCSTHHTTREADLPESCWATCNTKEQINNRLICVSISIVTNVMAELVWSLPTCCTFVAEMKWSTSMSTSWSYLSPLSLFRMCLALCDVLSLLKSHFGLSISHGKQRVCIRATTTVTAKSTLQDSLFAKGNASRLLTKIPMTRLKVSKPRSNC